MDLRDVGHRLGEKLTPIGWFLDRMHVSPNILTTLSIPFALGAGYFAFSGEYTWTSIFLLSNLAMDALDGITARATGKVTRLGSLLDKVADRYS